VTVECDRFADHLHEPLGDDRDILGVRDAAEQNRKFVPPDPRDLPGFVGFQPRDRVARSKDSLQSRRNLPEQFIPRAVTEAVVDLLEVKARY
jgi:hypothetical protein